MLFNHPYFLTSLPLDKRSQLPPIPGIYYCMDGWKILYIGKAVSLRLRWNSKQYGEHHKLSELTEKLVVKGEIVSKYKNVRIHYRMVKGDRYRSHVEAKEICQYRPPLNRRMEPLDPWFNFWDWLQGFVFVTGISILGYWLLTR